MVRAHAYISGLVQGVYFRYYTSQQASSLGLVGWVRNLSDGRVEIVIEGKKEKVEKLLAWCHRGSPRAKVEKVQKIWEPYVGEFHRFAITG